MKLHIIQSSPVLLAWKLNPLHLPIIQIDPPVILLQKEDGGSYQLNLKAFIVYNSPYKSGDIIPVECNICKGDGWYVMLEELKHTCEPCKGTGESNYTIDTISLKQVRKIKVNLPLIEPVEFNRKFRPKDNDTYLCIATVKEGKE